MKPEESPARDLLPYFPAALRDRLIQLPEEQWACLEEIRLRANQPLLCRTAKHEFFYAESSGWVERMNQTVLRVTEREIAEVMGAFSAHSRYAFEEQIRSGFVTLPGGHRVGLSGQVICEMEKVKRMQHISGLVLRVARQCRGCADALLPFCFSPEGNLRSLLVISPPRCGKTTLLRDICRQLSNGSAYAPGRQITVVDERSELAGCYLGVPQLDVGCRTDVLDGCPKGEGIIMALRALSPAAVVTDEISRPEDIRQLMACSFSGVSVITSIHAADYREAQQRPGIRELLAENVFDCCIVLSRRRGPGTVEEIVEVRNHAGYPMDRHSGGSRRNGNGRNTAERTASRTNPGSESAGVASPGVGAIYAGAAHAPDAGFAGATGECFG